jgi:hypothetical protein
VPPVACEAMPVDALFSAPPEQPHDDPLPFGLADIRGREEDPQSLHFVHPSVSGIVRATGVPEYEPHAVALRKLPFAVALTDGPTHPRGWPSATIRSSSPKSIRTRPPATPLGPPDISPTPLTASSLPACLQSKSDALLTARTL